MTPPSVSTTRPVIISVDEVTNWEQRLLDEVRTLQRLRKDAIIHFDSRMNILRVYEARVVASHKLD